MSPRRLMNRVALVTGAAQGIGKGCALCLAEEGASVCINDYYNMDEAQRTVETIEALGGRALRFKADIGNLEEIDRLVEFVIDGFGHVDILVSNVTYEAHMGILDASMEEVRRSFDIGLLGAFRLAQRVAQHMVKRKSGRIIFISSIHGERPFANAIAYNVVKAGINHLALSMATELAPYRITVNAIAPGWIDTPGERQWYSSEELKRAGARLPWGRMGTPRDVGKAAAFLASDDADYITGTILKVDGGLTASLSLETLDT